VLASVATPGVQYDSIFRSNEEPTRVSYGDEFPFSVDVVAGSIIWLEGSSLVSVNASPIVQNGVLAAHDQIMTLADMFDSKSSVIVTRIVVLLKSSRLLSSGTSPIIEASVVVAHDSVPSTWLW